MLQEISSVCSDLSIIRRLIFAVANLPGDTPGYWEVVTKFGYKCCTTAPPTSEVQVLLENIDFLDHTAFAADISLQKELINQDGFEGHPLGIVLVSSNSTCKLCQGELQVRSDRPSYPVIYSEDLGTVSGTHFRKYCRNSWKGCSFTQHYGFHMNGIGSDTVYDSDCLDLPFFISSHSTGFQTKLLLTLTAEILLGQLSYRQRADIYNYTHGYELHLKKGMSRASGEENHSNNSCSTSVTGNDRKQLDRRRLEEAHLKICIIKVFQLYPAAFPEWSISTDLQHELSAITPIYYEAFSSLYAEHQCSYPGCCNVLVIDGNMKNRRDVCAASEAGYIEYEGLPGSIKTGCQKSPGYQSKYCYDHSPRIALISPENEGDKCCEGVMGVITAKKETRNGIYYQVAWVGHQEKLTWEPASALPSAVIEEFESNDVYTEDTSSDTSFGVTNHTVIITKDDQTEPPPPKRGRKSIPSRNSGIFVEATTTAPLTCNTEKDKFRLRHRTAGILAGIRPCGMIVLLSELFTSESKSQVYAILHEFFRKHPDVSKSTEFICYDDACHLRKYAINPTRKDCTPTAQDLSKIEIVVDKMHMTGHTDKWCRLNCDPQLFPQLNKVDTEVCEQCFSWLSRYGKMTRKMQRSNFMFFLIFMCDMHNRREECKLRRSLFMK